MADATQPRDAQRVVTADELQGPGVPALWTGVLGPPLAFLVALELSYALVQWGCHHETELPLHITAVATIGVALALAAFALHTWRRVDGWPNDTGGPLSRTRFLAALGALTAVFFLLVVIAMWVPVFVLAPCLKA